MATIAEISQAGPGQPIVGLQATVKSCFAPKAFGNNGGTMQNGIIFDHTGEVPVQFIDVEAYQGMPFMASAGQVKKNVLGREQVTWNNAAYTEEYNGKFRFTIRKSGLTILAGGPAASAPPPAPAYAAAPPPQAPAYPPAPVGPQSAPYGMQPATPAPGYPTQPIATPAPAYGQPGPSTGYADPAWAAGAGLASQSATQVMAQAAPAPLPVAQAMPAGWPGQPWQPKAKVKLTVDEAMALIEATWVRFTDDLCRDFEVESVKGLDPAVVAGAMSWATSIFIGIEQGHVEMPAKPQTALGTVAEREPGDDGPEAGSGAGDGPAGTGWPVDESEITFGG